MKLSLAENTAPLKNVFAISRGAKTEAKTVIVQLQSEGAIGRGECVPYPRYGESPASVMAQIEQIRADIEAGMDRETLRTFMRAGAARCAIDCAMWDLEARLTGVPVWQRAGLPLPEPIETAVTVSLDTPDAMGTSAASINGQLLKLKLGGVDDLARLEAVHTARPDARLILDGNEGMLASGFRDFAVRASELGTVLIEQPFPAEADAALTVVRSDHSPRPAICADESVHTATDIPDLAERYDAVNIKLDKAGGLTEALAMIKAARAADMQVMIGCMVAGSLSMAPAVLLAGLADLADLDGPIWLAHDIEHGLNYDAGLVSPPLSELWGAHV